VWVAGITVRLLDNTCHTSLLLGLVFFIKRRYIKCLDLLLLDINSVCLSSSLVVFSRPDRVGVSLDVLRLWC